MVGEANPASKRTKDRKRLFDSDEENDIKEEETKDKYIIGNSSSAGRQNTSGGRSIIEYKSPNKSD